LSRIAASLGENEFVLGRQPQAIGVAAMTNDNVASANKQISTVNVIVDDRQSAL
jgi:hypothetical protein